MPRHPLPRIALVAVFAALSVLSLRAAAADNDILALAGKGDPLALSLYLDARRERAEAGHSITAAPLRTTRLVPTSWTMRPARDPPISPPTAASVNRSPYASTLTSIWSLSWGALAIIDAAIAPFTKN